MTARDEIRAIVDEQLRLIAELSKAGFLSADDLDRLLTLTKTAALSDRLEVPKVADPTDALDDAELEKLANG